MLTFSPTTLTYQDANGNWQSIRQCSIVNREMLRLKLTQLVDYTNAMDAEQTFAEAWEQDGLFRHLCNECMQLAGIDASTLSLDHYVTFLMPTEAYPAGLLVELNFGKLPNQAESMQAKGQAMTHRELIAIIWRVLGNLSETIAFANNIPADEAIALLNEKGKQEAEAQLKPEDRLKKRAKDELKSMLDGVRANARQSAS